MDTKTDVKVTLPIKFTGSAPSIPTDLTKAKQHFLEMLFARTDEDERMGLRRCIDLLDQMVTYEGKLVAIKVEKKNDFYLLTFSMQFDYFVNVPKFISEIA